MRLNKDILNNVSLIQPNKRIYLPICVQANQYTASPHEHHISYFIFNIY